MGKVNWIEVTKLNQVKVGTKLKIIGKASKNDYKAITVKKLVRCGNDTEIILNLKKNYFFNLSAYLDKVPLWGGWVKEVYFKQETRE